MITLLSVTCVCLCYTRPRRALYVFLRQDQRPDASCRCTVVPEQAFPGLREAGQTHELLVKVLQCCRFKQYRQRADVMLKPV